MTDASRAKADEQKLVHFRAGSHETCEPWCARCWFEEGYNQAAEQTAALRASLVAWARDRMDAETAHRPDQNIHKQTLVETWTQVINRLELIPDVPPVIGGSEEMRRRALLADSEGQL